MNEVAAILAETLITRFGARSRESSLPLRTPCPFHDGEDANFVLFASGVGKCWSVCGRTYTPREIAEMLGVTLPVDKGVTVKVLLDSFALPDEISTQFSLSESIRKGKSCVVIPYFDESGEVLQERRRLSIVDGQRFDWKSSGGRSYPYGLHRLPEIRRTGRCLIVEGESDVWACTAGGIPALGIPGANSWREEYRQYFAGLEVGVWREPGDAARSFVESISLDLPSARILSHENAKDPAELWQLVTS
jgi:hypothetical protein